MFRFKFTCLLLCLLNFCDIIKVLSVSKNIENKLEVFWYMEYYIKTFVRKRIQPGHVNTFYEKLKFYSSYQKMTPIKLSQ